MKDTCLARIFVLNLLRVWQLSELLLVLQIFLFTSGPELLKQI